MLAEEQLNVVKDYPFHSVWYACPLSYLKEPVSQQILIEFLPCTKPDDVGWHKIPRDALTPRGSSVLCNLV